MKFGYRAAQIAPAHAELDRNVALVAFVVDVSRAGIQRNFRNVFERNIACDTAAVGVANAQVTHILDIDASRGRIADRQPVLAVTFKHRGRHRTAHGGLNRSVDVARIQSIASSAHAVNLNVQIRLPECVENAQVGYAVNLGHGGHHIDRQLFQRRQVWPDDLHRIGAFDARQPFFNVVLNVLGKIETYARELVGKLVLQLRNQPLFGHAGRPFLKGLERCKQLHIVKTRRVAAIIGSTVLGHHSEDFRVALDDLAHAVGFGRAGFQRNGWRHGSANPQIAFFKCR